MRLIGTHRIAAAWMPHFKSGEGNLIAFKRTIYACFGIAAKHPMETIGHLLLFIAAQGLLANSHSQPKYPEATFFKSLNHAGGRAFPGNTEVSRTWGRPTCSQFAVVWMHFESFPPPRFAAVLNTMHPNPPEATSLAVGKCRFATYSCSNIWS